MKVDDIKNIAIVGGLIIGLSYLKTKFDQSFEIPEAEVNNENLTYNRQLYAQLAEALEEAFWYSWQLPIPVFDDENGELITAILLRMQNDDDVSQLLNDYGARCRPYPDVICSPETLVTSVINRLNPDFIDQINEDWTMKGMTYQF